MYWTGYDAANTWIGHKFIASSCVCCTCKAKGVDWGQFHIFHTQLKDDHVFRVLCTLRGLHKIIQQMDVNDSLPPECHLGQLVIHIQVSLAFILWWNSCWSCTRFSVHLLWENQERVKVSRSGRQHPSAAKDGLRGFSQWRYAAEDSQPSLCGDQCQSWELRGKKEKLKYRDCQHHAGYGGEEQCRAGGHLQMGNDLANYCWLTTSRTFQDRSRNDQRRVDLADDVCRFSSELTVLCISIIRVFSITIYNLLYTLIIFKIFTKIIDFIVLVARYQVGEGFIDQLSFPV